MKKKLIVVSALAGTLLLSPALSFAEDQQRDQLRDQDRLQTQDQLRDQIYGSQLMTDQERNEFRARMRAAKTAEERERIRNEHHERMKIRAQEQGVTLPDEPPMRGKGMGQGGGMGPGMGKGMGR